MGEQWTAIISKMRFLKCSGYHDSQYKRTAVLALREEALTQRQRWHDNRLTQRHAIGIEQRYERESDREREQRPGQLE